MQAQELVYLLRDYHRTSGKTWMEIAIGLEVSHSWLALVVTTKDLRLSRAMEARIANYLASMQEDK